MAPSQAIVVPKGNRWSEDRLFKLLFLAIGDIKTSYAELADQWANRYRESFGTHCTSPH
jgi:hypothetical protein